MFNLFQNQTAAQLSPREASNQKGKCKIRLKSISLTYSVNKKIISFREKTSAPFH